MGNEVKIAGVDREDGDRIIVDLSDGKTVIVHLDEVAEIQLRRQRALAKLDPSRQ